MIISTGVGTSGAGQLAGNIRDGPSTHRPTLPVRPGHPEAASSDYVRHGTTTLFAAFEMATGKVIEPPSSGTATRSSHLPPAGHRRRFPARATRGVDN
jgi:hypothetical protein